MKPEIIALIISTVSILIAGISLFFAWRKLTETHEWNRRKSTDDALRFLVSGDYQKLTDEFHKIIPFEEWTKTDTTYQDICQTLNDEERILITKYSWDLLNIFEALCIGIKNNILDEDICYDYLAFILPRFFHWSQHFIQERRTISGELRLYLELETIANKWSKRKKEQDANARQSLQIKGKSKL